MPEGAVRFELSAEEIAEALAEESGEVAAPEDIPVPDALLPAEEVQALVAERRPAYVPVDGGEAVRAVDERIAGPWSRSRTRCRARLGMTWLGPMFDR